MASPSARRLVVDYTLAAAAIAYAIAVVLATPIAGNAPTSYAATSQATRVADLMAGIGLLVAGLVSRSEPRTRTLGLLIMLAGAAWFAPDWDGWEGGSSLVRSMGAFGEPLYLAVIFHIAVAAPGGSLRSRAARRGVLGVYTAALTAAVAIAALRDPFQDPYCWSNCLNNAFVVHADQPAAHVLQRTWMAATVAIGALVAGLCGWRMLSAARAERTTLAPLAVPCAAIGVSTAAYGAWLLHAPLEVPTATGFHSLFLLRALATLALASGAVALVIRDRRTRAAVAQLAVDVARAPVAGTFSVALAQATGDPTIEVVYWLPESRRYVDAEGDARTPPAAGAGRAVTHITRSARTLALVGHASDLAEQADLEREIGAAARLAVDNERLRAEALAQLNDLRSALARIVETGDAERRRLERNLHDGAQQRLLAVSFELRMARSEQAADAGRTQELDAALRQVDAALSDLRDLAHGIYPAVLTEAGLAAAIATLAELAPLPVEVGQIGSERYPEAVERGVYVTVSEAIDDAVSRTASTIQVTVSRGDGRLVAVVLDDGELRDEPPRQISDRVGALGGSTSLVQGALRAEIPCG